MSNRERIVSLLDTVPEYKMGYILAYIQGIVADEEADDIYCQELVDQYLADDSPDKHETISIEELGKELGITSWNMKS